MRICCVAGCNSIHVGKGYCKKHYGQIHRNGIISSDISICKFEGCGKEFVKKRADQIFCSDDCCLYSNKSKSITRTAKCENDKCQKEFITKIRYQIYCSRECCVYVNERSQGTKKSQFNWRNSDKAKISIGALRQKYKENGSTSKYNAKNREKYPERIKARSMAINNLKQTEICSIDGCLEIDQRHHHDYSKPLDVVWLCVGHHVEEHNRLRMEV